MKPLLTVLLIACAPEAPPAGESCFNGARCCPAGFAAQGLTRDGRQLVCGQAGDEMQDCFIDHATWRQGVQACPEGTAVRGINRSAHTLVCCFDRRRGYEAMRGDETLAPEAESCPSGQVITGDSSGDYSSRVLFDVSDMAALAAPARYLVTWGTQDENFGESYQAGATRRAQAVYASLGIPERIREVRFEGAHEWNAGAADEFAGAM